MFRGWGQSVVLLMTVMCLAQTPGPSQPTPHFQDISVEAGLNVSHLSSPDKRYVVESMSGGVGFIDCDNDGKLDIIAVNGSSVDRFRQGGNLLITLYRQETGLKFHDITAEAGLATKGWGMGVAVADFDNDGWDDIYATGYGGNVLYRNLGNCKFQDVTEKAGLRVGGFSSGAAWGDYDRDGKVDLFVPRYVVVDIANLPAFGSDAKTCRFRGVPVQCGPWGLPGEADFLFHNRGDGSFEDVSKKAGVSDPDHRYGLQGVWADYDNDGWPDLYVANDGNANYLYHNRHNGTFEDAGLLSGAALSADGREEGSMGVDFGDIDHDGLLDIFVSEFTEQPDLLFWNRGAQGFTEISSSSHLGQPTYLNVGWGTKLFDVDNDGWLDLLVVNGHVYPQMDAVKGGAPYRQPIQLFRNHRDRTFDDISVVSGLDQLPLESRRGAAFGDVNNDGKVDVLVLNVGALPTLLLNRTASPNHAALFKLLGTKSNKSAIGARVTVTCGDVVQFGEVQSGGSYMSQNDLRLHFGLGQHEVMNTVEIWWPSGQKQSLKAVPADSIYTIVEGEGIKQKTPFALSDPQASQMGPSKSTSR